MNYLKWKKNRSNILSQQ